MVELNIWDLLMAIGESNGLDLLIGLVLFLVLVVPALIGQWKLLVKAGLPGWSMFVPFFNLYCFFKMARLPIWIVVGFFIPGVNFVVILWCNYNIAKNFGKGIGWTILLSVFPIAYAILGFSDATFQPKDWEIST